MSTTITSREFNRDTGAAKRATANGPVLITDRGQPAHVLLTYAAYETLLGTSPSIVALLAAPHTSDMDLDVPRDRTLARVADLD